MNVVLYLPTPDGLEDPHTIRTLRGFVDQLQLTVVSTIVERDRADGPGWAEAMRMVTDGRADKVVIMTRAHAPEMPILVVDEYVRPGKPERRTRIIRPEILEREMPEPDERPWGSSTYAPGTGPVPRAQRRTGRILPR